MLPTIASFTEGGEVSEGWSDAAMGGDASTDVDNTEDESGVGSCALVGEEDGDSFLAIVDVWKWNFQFSLDLLDPR